MGLYRTLTTLVSSCLALLLIYCHCSPRTQAAEAASAPRSQPVGKADDRAEAVIARAIQAIGGEKTFTRWRCGYIKYKSKGGIVPAFIGEMTVEDTFQLPGHLKRVLHMDNGGRDMVMIWVINNGKGWTKKGDGPSEPMDNNFTDSAEHTFAAFSNLAPLVEGHAQLTTLGDEKIGGREATGIRVQSDKLGEADLYFSLETGLLLKSRKSVPGTDPNKANIGETFLDEYKDVQGGKVPMRIRVTYDGKELFNIHLIDVKFSDRFDDATFAKP